MALSEKMTQTTPPPTSTTTTSPKRRSRGMLIGIVVIILIVVGVGVYYLFQGTTTSKPGAPVSIWDTGASGKCTQTASPPDCGFNPQSLTVKLGNSTVTWTNDGLNVGQHTASSNSTANGSLPAFDSQSLAHSAKYSFTFSTAGTYHYYCKIHPWMTGTITVTS